jgi:hypothetical protein
MQRYQRKFIENKKLTFQGALGKKGPRNMCFQNARKLYFKLKKNNKNIKYMEGKVFVNSRYTISPWVDHAWVLLENGKIHDPTYGENSYTYEGYIIPDIWMYYIPDYMLSYLSYEKKDYKILLYDFLGQKSIRYYYKNTPNLPDEVLRDYEKNK